MLLGATWSCEDAGEGGDACGEMVCAQWEECRPDSGICTLQEGRCDASEKCPAGLVCDGDHRCVEDPVCTSDDQCLDPALPLCGGNGVCTSECEVSAECAEPGLPLCSFGRCVASTVVCASGEEISLVETSFREWVQTRVYGQNGDDTYVPPPADYLEAFNEAVTLMIQGDPCGAQTLAASADMILVKILDTDSGFTSEHSNEYTCLEGKAEAGDTEPDPSLYRGVYCVRSGGGVPTQDLHIAIPHPKFDVYTNLEGAEVFSLGDARYFSLATAHRDSSTEASPCDPDYRHSDMAHNIDSLFHLFAQRVHDLDADSYHVQLHGYVDAVVALTSAGTHQNLEPDAVVLGFTQNLKAAVSEYEIAHVDPADGPVRSCNDAADDGLIPDFCATQNMQGRYVNGSVTDTCGESPTSFSASRFIHVEQTRWLRGRSITDPGAADYLAPKYFLITSALAETFPLVLRDR